jgi:hypothetical protein
MRAESQMTEIGPVDYVIVTGSMPCWFGPEASSSPWAVRYAPVPPVAARATGPGPAPRRSISPCAAIWPCRSDREAVHRSTNA